MGFDIQRQKEATRAEDEGIDVHIHGLDGEPMYYALEENPAEEFPVTIRVAGAHSSLFRQAEETLRRRKLKASTFTGTKIYEDNLFKVVQCTLNWDGFTDGESNLPFTKDAVRQVYMQFPWVLDQVMEAMNDHSRFFEKESG